jgi:hypothetical protein
VSDPFELQDPLGSAVSAAVPPEYAGTKPDITRPRRPIALAVSQQFDICDCPPVHNQHYGQYGWTVSDSVGRFDRVRETTGGVDMPTFMDVHTVEGGVSAADVAGAHQADLATQAKYGVDYTRYWVDEEAGKIFCLVDAPDAETAAKVHREAHGLVADEIYPVSEGS